MTLLEPREGRTQVQVLSAIAHLQVEKKIRPRVKDITDVVRLSKGAVSNNCKKLLDQGFVKQEDKQFELDKAKLFNQYREHFEEYLVREPDSELFSEDVKRKNEARTKTKKNLHGWFKNQTIKDMAMEILIKSLLAVRHQSRIQTLREVFFYADDLIRQTNEKIEQDMWDGKQKGSGGEIREAFNHFAQCLDWGTHDLDDVFDKMKKGQELFDNGQLRSDIKEKLDKFCHENGVKKLSIFGSAVREDFSPISDIDVLVKFKESKSLGLIELSGLERELEDIFERKVDLVTQGGLTDDFRDRIQDEVSIQYEAT
ncbi:MAG: nucleotidyltransferase domain-containing protein [bacterium]